jgi:hypothetical protein
MTAEDILIPQNNHMFINFILPLFRDAEEGHNSQ